MIEIDDTAANYRKKCLKQKLPVCNVCGYGEHAWTLVVHHIDGDRSNNSLQNLIPLCNSCHKKVHNIQSYGGRIDELSGMLNSEVVEIPDDVVEWAREVRDKTSATSIGDAIQKMCRSEQGYDV